MTWQKIERYISDTRIIVKSRKGNTYPADTDYAWMGEGIYEQMINTAHDDKEYWAWVSFDEDTPKFDDWKRLPEGEGPPEKPPWEY